MLCMDSMAAGNNRRFVGAERPTLETPVERNRLTFRYGVFILVFL